ncbi:MAG: HAD family hydrolase [Lachnospiraceae bacterium]|nr:HAD family hydrolase [Lachnospiraceae bacterium]
MKTNIDTIFFDVGATLRYVVPDEEFAAAAEKELMELVGTTESHDEFFGKLEANWKAYRKFAKTELIDVSEMELWLQYLLPDYPAEVLAPNSARLTRLWRDHDGRREAHPDVVPTLRELKRRGYKLGIIANTITETEIPDWMCSAGVADCFKTVILSSKVRLRKPDVAIYQLAARCIDSPVENCAYVGDNPVRDVEGAVNSGFGSMILYEDAGTADREGKLPTVQPDVRIRSIGELLELFPDRN